MDKTNITVTMPVTEYEHLKAVEQSFNDIVRMLEMANVNGEAVLTDELRRKIEDIYY